MEGEVIPGPAGMPRIDFGAVHVKGQRPSERSSDTVNNPANSSTSQGGSESSNFFEFDPVHITATKIDVSSEQNTSREARADLNSPSQENNTQRISPDTELGKSPETRAEASSPDIEIPEVIRRGSSPDERYWREPMYDDYTEGARMPSFVYPPLNSPKSKPQYKGIKERQKKSKKVKRREIKSRTDATGVAQRDTGRGVEKNLENLGSINTPRTAEEEIEQHGGLAKLQARNLYFPGGGYYYTEEWEIGDVSDGVTAERAMKVLQSNPDSIFPFGVEGKILEGERVNLRNPRGFFVPKLTDVLRFFNLSNNHVVVQRVTKTSFTFRTESDHFDKAGGLITFSTFERNGKVYLRQSAYAPNASTFSSIIAPIGSKGLWGRQQFNLESHLKNK